MELKFYTENYSVNFKIDSRHLPFSWNQCQKGFNVYESMAFTVSWVIFTHLGKYWIHESGMIMVKQHLLNFRSHKCTVLEFCLVDHKAPIYKEIAAWMLSWWSYQLVHINTILMYARISQTLLPMGQHPLESDHLLFLYWWWATLSAGSKLCRFLDRCLSKHNQAEVLCCAWFNLPSI